MSFLTGDRKGHLETQRSRVRMEAELEGCVYKPVDTRTASSPRNPGERPGTGSP